MFLVTTANQSFWSKEEPILFLGEWCRLYSQKHVWSKLEHEVLSYHAYEKDVLFDDYKYSVNVYEGLLVQLSQVLNKLHQTNHSVRYWRIVLGPWLLRFIQVFLDRYRSICNAADSDKVTNTWITLGFLEKLIPNDLLEFNEWQLEDQYNHYLFSEIIRSVEKIPWEEKKDIDFSLPKLLPNQISFKKQFKGFIFRLIEQWPKVIPDSLQTISFIDTYIKPIDLLRLQFSIGMMPLLYRTRKKISPIELNGQMRGEINLGPRKNQFESILAKCLPFQIPKIYLEGYSKIVQSAEEMFPKKPKVILTASAHHRDDYFKFWAGGEVERGAKLAISQHGGNVGDALWSTNDSHELKISDRYFSWGWIKPDENKIVQMPSSMLASVKGKVRPKLKGTILCVSCSFPRYSYVMFSAPTSSIVLKAFEFQEKFFRVVSPEIHELLIMRLFMFDRGWEEKLRWHDSDASPKIYQGEKSLYNHLSENRLCICFYNGTPLLETFVANYPTLLCWDPNYAEFNKTAQPYYNTLREAGILHDTPEALAREIKKIYSDPMSWWMSHEVQEAREKFCDQFARTSKKWHKEWKGELLRLAKD
jgi:putative transferase (TIGR04331 family)